MPSLTSERTRYSIYLVDIMAVTVNSGIKYNESTLTTTCLPSPRRVETTIALDKIKVVLVVI